MFALNSLGQIFGLLEFDRLEYTARDLEAILLFERKVCFTLFLFSRDWPAI